MDAGDTQRPAPSTYGFDLGAAAVQARFTGQRTFTYGGSWPARTGEQTNSMVR